MSSIPIGNWSIILGNLNMMVFFCDQLNDTNDIKGILLNLRPVMHFYVH